MSLTINWRGDVPKEPLKGQCEGAVQAAVTAAWNTTGKTFVQATIRGADHAMTTNAAGFRVPDSRHITVNFKDTAQVRNNTHSPAHVYLQNQRPDFNIDRVDWYRQKRDATFEDLDEDEDDGLESKDEVFKQED